MGAVARSKWAWSFAPAPDLASDLPDVAHAVRTGEGVNPPGEYQLLLGVTRSLKIWISSQPGTLAVQVSHRPFYARPFGVLVHGPRVDLMPTTAIQCPLFKVLLARINDPSVPHVPDRRLAAGSSRDENDRSHSTCPSSQSSTSAALNLCHIRGSSAKA